jgi:hypothetical protein
MAFQITLLMPQQGWQRLSFFEGLALSPNFKVPMPLKKDNSGQPDDGRPTKKIKSKGKFVPTSGLP